MKDAFDYKYYLIIGYAEEGIFVVHARTPIEAVIEVAEYCGVNLEYLHKAQASLSLNDVIDLYCRLGVSIDSVVEFKEYDELFGDIAHSSFVINLDNRSDD